MFGFIISIFSSRKILFTKLVAVVAELSASSQIYDTIVRKFPDLCYSGTFFREQLEKLHAASIFANRILRDLKTCWFVDIETISFTRFEQFEYDFMT